MSEQTVQKALHWLVVGYVSPAARTWIEEKGGQLRDLSSDPPLVAVALAYDPAGVWVWQHGEQQITQLRSVLPSQAEREEACKGLARIDTTRMRKVIEYVQKDAEATILELGLSPLRRTRRQVDVAPDDMALIVDEPRKRRSLELGATARQGAKRRTKRAL